jgi:hypothetical protein
VTPPEVRADPETGHVAQRLNFADPPSTTAHSRWVRVYVHHGQVALQLLEDAEVTDWVPLRSQ